MERSTSMSRGSGCPYRDAGIEHEPQIIQRPPQVGPGKDLPVVFGLSLPARMTIYPALNAGMQKAAVKPAHVDGYAAIRRRVRAGQCDRMASDPVLEHLTRGQPAFGPGEASGPIIHSLKLCLKFVTRLLSPV